MQLLSRMKIDIERSAYIKKGWDRKMKENKTMYIMMKT